MKRSTLRLRDRMVRVHNVNGGYPLPDGLTDDMEVRVVAIEVGTRAQLTEAEQ